MQENLQIIVINNEIAENFNVIKNFIVEKDGLKAFMAFKKIVESIQNKENEIEKA
jgi:hypothetical protein